MTIDIQKLLEDLGLTEEQQAELRRRLAEEYPDEKQRDKPADKQRKPSDNK